MAQAAGHFGGIDALVNNAGAIKLVGVEQLEPKRFDLLYQINTRAVMVCSQAALPYLKKSAGGHILNLSRHSTSRPSGSPSTAPTPSPSTA